MEHAYSLLRFRRGSHSSKQKEEPEKTREKRGRASARVSPRPEFVRGCRRDAESPGGQVTCSRFVVRNAEGASDGVTGPSTGGRASRRTRTCPPAHRRPARSCS